MTTRLRGKWALGIAPRNLTWVIGDRLAICERPGGCGTNHRRVRRQEEIIWLRENQFTCVVSVLAAPHNLHSYDEMGVPCLHRPVIGVEEIDEPLVRLYTDLREMLRAGGSDHPMRLLQCAGVDLGQPDTVRAVVSQLDALVTQLEAEVA